VVVEVLDGTGQGGSTTIVIAPGGVEAVTGGSATNFYAYCRITPESPADLPLLRGNYFLNDLNQTTKTCTEAR
jgi:hypothetical protein